MDYYYQKVEETLESLKANKQNGLNSSEAQKRLEQNGPNVLKGEKPKSKLVLFAEQFKDFLVIILIAAAIISLVIGVAEGEGILDGVIIIAIVIINAVIGVTQESKAFDALKALKDMASPQAKVIRGGELHKIASADVVTGDIVVLDAGDYIPADLRLIESVNLKIDESPLTGESVPVEKNAEAVLEEKASVGDRVNSAFMGTVVTYGRGLGVVTKTGMDTQMGSIASMLTGSENETTPLQKKLDKLGKTLGVVCLMVCVAIFGLGIMQDRDLMEIFMMSVSLAVAAIPEGLTVVVTVILAMGMQKMVKRGAIVKKLSAVETLGSTTVICSDKTGTLTQNKMTVVKLFDYNEAYTVTGTGYDSNGEIYKQENKSKDLSANIIKMAEGAVLCNDSVFERAEHRIIGDPTEGAMVVLGEKLGLNKASLAVKYPRVREIPFDSDRKLMSTFHNMGSGFTMYTKGAPDELLKRCTKILKNNEVAALSESDRQNLLAVNEGFANEALRVLGVAYKELNNVENYEAEEKDLIFTGLMCMIDPPREEVKPAVRECREAGIAVKMITGDHKITASAIAKDLGIMEEGGEAVEGIEIEAMTDAELQEKIKTVNVFARVSPEHKVRLVNAAKANGEIVSMTGDGVNDAPSLKKADIGVAMGITGTDVSKEAADMILTDDNFVSIVKAVEEGRTIYNNIRKVVGYLLSCNIGEIILMFAAMAFGLPMPLLPIHLLSINLITDAFPAFALGLEDGDEGVMKLKPRDPNESIIDRKMRVAVAMQSVFLGFGALGAYMFGRSFYGSDIAGTTICFVTLVLGELFRAYSARSEVKSIFKIKLFTNKTLNNCVIGSIIFLAVAVYIPFFNDVFKTMPLTIEQLLIAVGFAIIPVVGGELAKVVTRNN
ncbi:calcium-translocating P-type ATPase, PMCA-type [Tyzzerella sp. OttesenSCG-928-J15]|nr:calcium-translocating P-type ATPase, PMCA-type [Tyzzerella sp. OttesenSCG-928-J15]